MVVTQIASNGLNWHWDPVAGSFKSGNEFWVPKRRKFMTI
jgi:hypothetical protein